MSLGPKNNGLHTGYWVEFLPTPRWVRARLGKAFIADSKQAMLLREQGKLPLYFFPKSDVRTDLMLPSDREAVTENGITRYWDLKKDGETLTNGAWEYELTSEGAPDLSGYFAFRWEAMDAWFEEDDQIYRHARDPYKRIDVLHSSRHVQIILDGVTVADSIRPRLLFETGLPTRYYLPLSDVRSDLFIRSGSRSICPYKGTASYYSVKIGENIHTDIAWYYPYPIPECPKIENLVCFYNEHVEATIVDGEVEEKMQTPWSKK